MKSQGEQPGRRELVLHALRDAREPMRIADLAQQLGLHANTVRFHLAALVARGQVEQVVAQPQSPGRPLSCSGIPSRMDPTGPRQYRLLAEVLVDALAASPAPEEQAADAGRAGSASGARNACEQRCGLPSRLITLLDEGGSRRNCAPSSLRSRYATALSWNSRNAEPTSSVRYTSASCRAPWMSGMPRRPLINSPLRRTR